MEKKPHKHAEVIKAWADGERIEFRRPGESKWLDAPDPAFIEDYSYRVKPARVYPQTTMDSDETYRAMYSGPTTNNSAQCRAQLVNVGLRHAIDNGQVVTREEFNTVADEMNQMRATFRQVFGEEYRPGMVIKVNT